MPRKRKDKPFNDTLNVRYKNNPYFYKKIDTQNDNNKKYNEFARELRLTFRNLNSANLENLQLKKHLSLQINTVKELNQQHLLQSIELNCIKLENVSQQKIIDSQNDKLDLQNEEIKFMQKEIDLLKVENEKLKEQIDIYLSAIQIYRDEMARKIAGNVKPKLNTYFLNFN